MTSPGRTSAADSVRALTKLLSGHFVSEHGFKRSAGAWVCTNEDVVWLISLDRGKINTAVSTSVTLSLGVFVPNLWATFATYGTPEQRDKISLSACAIHQQIGLLTETNKSLWWSLVNGITSDGIESCAEEMLSFFTKAGLPFFRRFNGQDAVLQFLVGEESADIRVQPQVRSIRLAYASIIELNRGNYLAAKDAMVKAVAEEEANRIKDGYIKATFERLFSISG